jgi:hypothetical protein
MHFTSLVKQLAFFVRARGQFRLKVFADAKEFLGDSEVTLHRKYLAAKAALKVGLALPGSNDNVVARSQPEVVSELAPALGLVARWHPEVGALGVLAVIDLNASGRRRKSPGPLGRPLAFWR